jgi:NDP-4-keto-2,6-dideoxyhexose 3-C-methyltransferase
MTTRVKACRICNNSNLATVLELGNQVLTGVFPIDKNANVTSGPLTLLKCTGPNSCGLVQLAHSYSLAEMYGENYGYRSGLNPSMVAHLRSKVQRIEALGVLQRGDLVVDIGSNDATTLKQYEIAGISRAGVDPTGVKFGHYYGAEIQLIPDFFGAMRFQQVFGNRKAKVITSFSMFYDLEDPMAFMREVGEVLDDNGIWVFEQSYMPTMLTTNSYDTVCHEHLEYYALAQILWMTERVGLRVIDVELNDVNGGSFSVTVQKATGKLPESKSVRALMDAERQQRLDDLETYIQFAARVRASKESLLAFLKQARADGKRVVGLGASTKGNVILQYCGIDASLIECIGEINSEKFGAHAPGSKIPIVDEKPLLLGKPDYVLVLPWHFRKFFESQDRYRSLKLVYPLPVLSMR